MVDTWSFTVENISEGWSFSTSSSDPKPDKLSPSNPVQIRADFKGSWAFTDYPHGWQPRQADVSLQVLDAPTIRSLCEVTPGDRCHVSLTRQVVLFGVPVDVPWFRMGGFFDEPEVINDKSPGLVLKLGMYDPLAALAQIPIDDPVAWPLESAFTRIGRICQLAGINLWFDSGYAAGVMVGPVTVNNKSALSLLNECLDGLRTATSHVSLRGGLAGRDIPLAPAGYDNLVGSITGTTDPDQVIYWVELVGHTMTLQAPYVATADRDLGAPGAAGGVGMYVAAREPVHALWELSGDGAALSADDVLRDQTSWRKSIAAAVNTVKMTGITAAGDEASVVSSYPDLVKLYGPITRTLETQRHLDAAAFAVAASHLPDRATAIPDWTADSFVFTTRDLSQLELDAYVDAFYPEGKRTHTQLPIVITDVDETSALTGPDVSGVLIGAELTIVRGELQVKGQLLPELLAPVTGSKTSLITYSQMRTEPVFNFPAVQWSAFTYHSLSPNPWTTNDKTFDAAQAHPNFQHEQLSYRDMRLIGVDD